MSTLRSIRCETCGKIANTRIELKRKNLRYRVDFSDK